MTGAAAFKFDLDALARSIEARKQEERARRASMRLPEATTEDGVVFRYIPVNRRDGAQGNLCDDDWVFVCSCRHVGVILCEASGHSDEACEVRASRMRALGWKSDDGFAWRCPDCVTVWKIIEGEG